MPTVLAMCVACAAHSIRDSSGVQALAVEQERNPTALGADGVIGATCSAEPRCFDCEEKESVCKGVKDKFYPGILMAVAKKAVIKECQSANALDECGNHCDDKTRKERLAQAGGGCHAQCERVATCVYGDNR
jgi:hypothetical protein